MRAATSRCRSCGRRSSSRRSPTRTLAGYAAFAWPSPSSSPTHADCSKSSPAYPRASSTSFPSISSSPRSARSLRAERCPTNDPMSCRSPRARSTRCTTGIWWTWCRVGSPNIRSTTTGAKPSPSPSGRSPAAVACRSNSSGPNQASPAPNGCCRCFPCGASKPSSAPRSKRSANWSIARSATSSSTARTPNARPSTGSFGCSLYGIRSTTRIA